MYLAAQRENFQIEILQTHFTSFWESLEVSFELGFHGLDKIVVKFPQKSLRNPPFLFYSLTVEKYFSTVKL